MDDKLKPTLSVFGSFLSKLSENSDHVYWLSSPDLTKIQYISPAYERIWGRSREDLYQNPEAWITFLHPDDRNKEHPIHEMADKVARLGDSARFSMHYRIVRPDGEVRWIMDNGFPVYDNNGSCCGVTGVAVDITEEKKYELELKNAKEQAEAANRAKIQFIENMSHDIRTPLSGVIGMSGLLVQGLKDPQKKQYAQWINDSGEQLLKLLNGILEVISADTVNENDLHKEFFDLHRCMKDIIDLETPTAYLKNLDLHFQFDENIPKLVYSDRMKVHRILLNLLGNAIKFTEKGSVSIAAKLIEVKNQQAVIRFSVHDTGIGILEDQQERVFDRFHKVIPSYKGIYSGYGVGLHIVLTYVKLLGGDIQLTSKQGVGSTFEFNLAFEYLNVESAPMPFTDQNAAHEEQYQGLINKQCHVLIVEDNTIALRVIEAVAVNAGCSFTSAKDAESALKLIESNDFDLIITDIGLPGISGYDFTRAIRSNESLHNKNSTPIIGLTAHTKSHAEVNCFEAGMNDVYSKPITADLMQTILLKHMGSDSLLETQKRAKNRLGFDLPEIEMDLFSLDSFPMLDIDKAIKTVGKKELIYQVLQLMISDEIQKDINAIKCAYLEGNWDKIEKYAHKMKGGAMYVGTVQMQYASQYLERYIKAKQVRLLEPLYQQLIRVVNDTQDYIRVWLANPSNIHFLTQTGEL